MKRKIALITMACAFTLASTACNTVRGVGQDIESVATSVDRAT